MLFVIDDSGMDSITSEPIGLSKGSSASIPLNMTTFDGAEGLLPV